MADMTARRLLHEQAEEIATLRAEVERLRQERDAAHEMLREVDETLTEMGWHTDRGVLQRVRATLTPPDAVEEFCPCCKAPAGDPHHEECQRSKP